MTTDPEYRTCPVSTSSVANIVMGPKHTTILDSSELRANALMVKPAVVTYTPDFVVVVLAGKVEDVKYFSHER